MKILKFILLISFCTYNLTSQEWLEPFWGKDNVKLSEVQAVAEAHFATIDIHQKGSGFKQYKRFEWFWQHRLMQDGTFPPASLLYKERMKFDNSSNTKNKNKTQANDSWRNLGPFSSTGGYNGIGRVNCVRVNPHNGSIWAGTPAGGIWVSTNNGNSWSTITDNEEVITSLGVTSIAFHPSNSNIIYIASGDGDGSNTYSLGVLKSTDGGSSWKATGLSWNIDLFRTINKILIHPNNPDILYSAGSNGIHKSTDAGDNWTQIKSGSFKDIEFKPGTPNTIYASGTEMWRTTDGGSNWNELTNGFPTSGIRRIAIAVTADDSGVIYAVVGNSSGNNLKGVYLSTDSGDSFTELADNQPNMLGYEKDGDDTKGQAGYDLCIEADQDDWERVIIGGVNTWRSTNGGTDWEISSMWAGFHNDITTVHADQHDLWYDNTNNIMYLGNDGAVYKSSDFGDNWSWIGSGILATQFYKFGISQLDSAVYIGGTQDNGSKIHQSNGSWKDAIGGDGFESVVDHENKNILYGSIYYGKFFKSTNSGNSFKQINDLNSNGEYDDITETGAWSAPFILNPQESSTLILGMNNVWISKDMGDSFTKISDFNYGNNKLVEMAMAPSDTSVMYVAYSNRLYRTTNYGSTWDQMTRPGTAAISDIYIDDNNSNKLWVTNDGYTQNNKVFESTDGGSNWTNLSDNLPNIPTNTIVKQKDSDDKLWVGTDIGVYYKDDNMADWVAYNINLPNVIVTELEINYSDNQIYASTYGRGIWKADIPSALDVPTFLTPASNVNGITTDNLLIDWNSITNAANYDIQLSEVSNFGSFVENENVTPSQLTVSGLENFTKYYARVRAKSTHSQSDWTGTLIFTTIVDRVSLISPSNNATNRKISDKLTWTEVNGATEYQILIAENENFNVPIVDETTLLEEYDYTNFNYNTSYWWKVRAKDPSGSYGEWSFVRKFETKLDKPTLIQPSDNATNQSFSLTLDWSDVSGADEYNIQLSKDVNFGNPIINKNVIPSNEDLSGLDGYTKYFWRVSAINNGNASDWSDVFSFTTKIETVSLNTPSNNEINQDTSISFSWSSVSYADSYTIQLDIVNTFDNPELIEESSPNPNKIVKDLLFDTVYYWRVKVVADANNGGWSEVFSFRTKLETPNLVSPTNGINNQDLTGTLSWNNIASNSINHIQLSTKSDFSAIIKEESIQETEFDYSDLDNYRSYYWRVKAERGQNKSDWSSTNSFITKIGTTLPVQPANNSLNLHTTLGFSWQTVNYAQEYDYQLSLSETFDTGDLVESTVTDNILNQSNLLYDTVYYWRVRVVVGDNSGDWSETFNFRTKLAKPTLLSPSNGSTEVAVEGLMNWSNSSDNSDYRVQISDDIGFNNIISNELVAGNSFNYTNLENDKKYFWRVKAERNQYLSDWAELFSFNTPSTIDRPQLNSPSNLQRNLEITSVELKWLDLDNITSYSIQVSTDSDFNTLVVDENNLKTNSFNFNNMVYSQRYYWRVKGVREGGNESEWSVEWEFSTTLPVPLLTLPLDNNNEIELTGILDWENVKGANSYNIELSKDSQFATLINEFSKNTTNDNLDYNNLEEKTMYYWHVNSENSIATSKWSDTWRFQTKGIKSYVSNFDDYGDVTVSPNPFNENTTISLRMYNSTSVSVYITDIKGNRVINLANEIISGNSKVEYSFNKGTLSTGVYFLNIKAKQITKTLKIIIN